MPMTTDFTRKGFLGFGGAFLATGGLDAGAADDPVMPFVREWGEHAASMKNGFGGSKPRAMSWHRTRRLSRIM